MNNYKTNILRLYFVSLMFCILFLSITGCSNDVPVSQADSAILIDQKVPKILPAWESWIKLNSNEIKSLNSSDFSDLQFLSNLLQNKKIIQLGESSHGTSEFSRVKVRLIKYLHEILGFNIMAFESSVFNCFYAYNTVLNKGPVTLMKNSIFSVWLTEEVKELFSYIIETQNTAHPLVLAGFDIQSSSGIGTRYRPSFLRSVFQKISPEKAKKVYQLDSSFISTNLNIYDRDALIDIRNSLVTNFQSYIDLLESNWGLVAGSYPPNSPIPHIAKLSLLSNIALINMYFDSSDYKISMEDRDAGMAYNLAYLYNNVYPNEKFIVWSHNSHICYNGTEVKDNTPTSGTDNMGHYIQSYISKDIMYTVGLYMFTGKSAYNNGATAIVTQETSDNIEAVIYHAGYKYSFVDMLNQNNIAGNSWMFMQKSAKYWGVRNQSLVPRNQYDAILYIYETQFPDYIK